jgi:LPXTG-motif cell wall-anchored protein
MPFGARLRHGLAVTATLLAIAPATALAQGAGDDQYSDPFGEEATPTATPRAPAPAPAATAAPAQTPAPAPAQGQPAPAATAAPSGPRLPYTGTDDWLTAAAGALLLGAGLTLRARLRDPD